MTVFSTLANVGPVRAAHRFDDIALLRYLQSLRELQLPASAKLEVLQFGHGQSNPTFLLVLRWEANARRFVLRKKPPGKLLKSAHAVEREFQVLQALQSGPVPVPRVVCLSEDASIIGTPFYVMEHVEGRIFTDPGLREVDPEQRRQMYLEMAKTLAAIHSVNPDAVGLGRFGRTDNYCRRQVETWAKQYAASVSGSDSDPAMLELIGWLRAHVPDEDGGSQGNNKGLVHGDFRLDNLVFHPAEPRVIAVLDWELSTLGNQSSDVAYSCLAYRLPPGYPQLATILQSPAEDLPIGVPSESQFVADYTRFAKIPVLSPQAWKFYLAVSLFRAAAIFAGVYRRAVQGNASSLSALKYGELVGVLARSALEIAKEDKAGSPSPSPACQESSCSCSGFEPSPRVQVLRDRLLSFLKQHICPNEHILNKHSQSKRRWEIHPLQEELKERARSQGLWNLWVPREMGESIAKVLLGGKWDPLLCGGGLSNLEYAHVCEVMGRSVWAPECFNCSAPDTGNMEVLARYGSPAQQRQWLLPLLQGDIRSCFAMTEPDVASSDATNIQASITKTPEGNHYILQGKKWWTSGAMDPRCSVAIFMGKTDPSAPKHRQQSMVIADMKAPGVTVVRPLTVFGFDDAPHGHAEVHFHSVKVPAENLLLGEGRGFEIAQGRLGPGRLHHCMRLVGAAERSMELMVERSLQRKAFGKPLAAQGSLLAQIAQCRIAVEQTRLLVLNAAHQLDLHGNKKARRAIAMAKVVAPQAVTRVIDVAMQIHGAGGLSSDFPMAHLWAAARTLRIADGPDEVHLLTIGRLELARARL